MSLWGERVLPRPEGGARQSASGWHDVAPPLVTSRAIDHPLIRTKCMMRMNNRLLHWMATARRHPVPREELSWGAPPCESLATPPAELRYGPSTLVSFASRFARIPPSIRAPRTLLPSCVDHVGWRELRPSIRLYHGFKSNHTQGVQSCHSVISLAPGWTGASENLPPWTVVTEFRATWTVVAANAPPWRVVKLGQLSEFRGRVCSNDYSRRAEFGNDCSRGQVFACASPARSQRYFSYWVIFFW